VAEAEADHEHGEERVQDPPGRPGHRQPRPRDPERHDGDQRDRRERGHAAARRAVEREGEQGVLRSHDEQAAEVDEHERERDGPEHAVPAQAPAARQQRLDRQRGDGERGRRGRDDERGRRRGEVGIGECEHHRQRHQHDRGRHEQRPSPHGHRRNVRLTTARLSSRSTTRRMNTSR
jgi:hypothetical protein